MLPGYRQVSCAASTASAMQHFYKWRSRHGGMEISDTRKLKALEDENRRLKKLLAESMLDASTLKEMLGKNF
jgi:putative transposase